ncbi:MAG TPA: COX15/CtaA family protein [Gemmatimonadaceae bacterium]|nr:COX15/CtaA family protein [Gemmatimonadaceae bacterium]
MKTIRRLAYLALVIGFAQVVFGAIVRITGSGLGCGDHWPDCYGSFTPAHGAPTLLVEISHRYGAAALSLAIILLAVVAWSKRSEPGVGGRRGALRSSIVAVALVVVAAIFGAITVKMALNPFVVVTHLAIAMALLGVLVATAVRTGGFGAAAIPGRHARTFRSGRAAAGLTFLALVFGALTANTPSAAVACQGFPWCRSVVTGGTPLYIQITHRIIALLLLGHLIGLWFGVRKRGEARPIRSVAGVALSLVVLQILIAAAMVEMHLPPGLRSLHQAVGTALWITVMVLTTLASASGSSDIERIVYESPSRGEFATPEGVST